MSSVSIVSNRSNVGEFTNYSHRLAHHGRTVDVAVFLPEGISDYPAVIFSHGYNSCMTDFYGAGEYFSSRGIAAVCFNFCGGGLRDNSGFPTTSMTLETERQDLLAVHEYISSLDGVSRVFLFGSSQGGMISALAAEKLQDKIGGLMLQFPALCIPDDWRRKFPEDSDIPEVTELWGMKLGREFAAGARGLELSQAIGSYGGNVLIMHGDKDDIVPLRYSEWAAKTYKNARLEIFPGEGHVFCEKENQRMNEMCVEFIRNRM